jgi:hypothetical protein
MACLGAFVTIEPQECSPAALHVQNRREHPGGTPRPHSLVQQLSDTSFQPQCSSASHRTRNHTGVRPSPGQQHLPSLRAEAILAAPPCRGIDRNVIILQRCRECVAKKSACNGNAEPGCFQNTSHVAAALHRYPALLRIVAQMRAQRWRAVMRADKRRQKSFGLGKVGGNERCLHRADRGRRHR